MGNRAERRELLDKNWRHSVCSWLCHRIAASLEASYLSIIFGLSVLQTFQMAFFSGTYFSGSVTSARRRLTNDVAPSHLKSASPLKGKFYLLLTWALVPKLGHRHSELFYLLRYFSWSSDVQI